MGPVPFLLSAATATGAALLLHVCLELDSKMLIERVDNP